MFVIIDVLTETIYELFMLTGAKHSKHPSPNQSKLSVAHENRLWIFPHLSSISS